MKWKTMKRLLCVSAMIVSLCAVPSVSFAEVENSVEAAGEEDSQTEEKEIKDVVFALNGEEIVIGNRTDKNIDKTAVVWKQLPAEGQEEPISLLLADDTGIEHTFEEAEPKKWSAPILVEDFGFLYIQYLDEAQANQEIAEKGEEKDLAEKAAIHVTADVNVRSEADVESAALQGAVSGTVFTVVGSAPGWVKVEVNNGAGYGYISHKFIAVEDSSTENVNTQSNSTVSGTVEGTQSSSTDYSRNTGSGSTNQGSSNSGNNTTRNTSTGNTNTGNNTTENNTTGNTTKGNNTSGNSTSDNTAKGGNSSSDTSSNTNNVADSVADVDIPDIDYGSSDSTQTGGGSSGSESGGGDDSPSYTEPEAEPVANEVQAQDINE